MNDTAELLARKFVSGTSVTNCVAHMGRKIDERPDNCALCLADLKNHFNYALRVNAWLNEWKEAAERHLADFSDAAKTMVEHLCEGGCEAVCPAIEGLRELIEDPSTEHKAKEDK
jgi:hypothetical protein